MKRILLFSFILLSFLMIGCNEKQNSELINITITFDSNGGTSVDSQTIEKGTKIQEPLPPTMEGYTFEGWYLEDEKFSFIEYTATEDVTLVAKWKEIIPDKEYVIVSFDSKGGASVENQKIEKGNLISKPIDPTKDGYKFDGWYLGDEKWSFIKDVVSVSITIEAKWIKLYDYTYSGNIATITKYLGEDENIVIPNKIDEYTVEIIGAKAFEENDLIKKVLISEGIKYIEGTAFYNCTNLNEISLPSSLVSFGNHTFYGCTNITEISIPSGVSEIPNYAFYNCKKLVSVELPESLTIIKPHAFQGCTKLCNINIPNSVTDIGDYAFSGCALESVIIPEKIEFIRMGTFAYCAKLKFIAFPEGLTFIGAEAFKQCSSLKSITIPKFVNKIIDDAFASCNFDCIYYGGSESDWKNITIGNNTSLKEEIIVYNYSTNVD